MIKYSIIAFNEEQMKIIQSYRLEEVRLKEENGRLRAEIIALRDEYLNASALVTNMHKAAMGEITGPVLGVVEDVADLRAELEAARAMSKKQHDFISNTVLGHLIRVHAGLSRAKMDLIDEYNRLNWGEK